MASEQITDEMLAAFMAAAGNTRTPGWLERGLRAALAVGPVHYERCSVCRGGGLIYLMVTSTRGEHRVCVACSGQGIVRIPAPPPTVTAPPDLDSDEEAFS